RFGFALRTVLHRRYDLHGTLLLWIKPFPALYRSLIPIVFIRQFIEIEIGNGLLLLFLHAHARASRGVFEKKRSHGEFLLQDQRDLGYGTVMGTVFWYLDRSVPVKRLIWLDSGRGIWWRRYIDLISFILGWKQIMRNE